MNNKCAPIGVFDSGVGGLTVVKEIMRQIPNEKIVYFGDTARVPYGGKSKDTIIRYSNQIINFLKTKDVKAIVVACNTASALALEEIEKKTDIPIIGVVKPGAKVASETTRNKKIGVIGTAATIGSELYSRYIHKLDKAITVYGKACPLFVPLVEEGWLNDPVTMQVAERYLAELKEYDVDTLILGCTHYPLLSELIAEVMGDGVSLVNPAYETAVRLKELLVKNDIVNDTDTQDSSQHEFYVSDIAEKFKGFAEAILSKRITLAKHINMEEY